MVFDKSKVCVAGLHEVKEGTKIEMLNGCALINDINPSFLYKLYTLEDGTPIGIPE